MGRAVELHELAFSGRSQAAQGFSAEREALCFNELFMEMMIVETGVARACQREDAVAGGLRGASMAGTTAADVRQSRCAALPITQFEPLEMSKR